MKRGRIKKLKVISDADVSESFVELQVKNTSDYHSPIDAATGKKLARKEDIKRRKEELNTRIESITYLLKSDKLSVVENL